MTRDFKEKLLEKAKYEGNMEGLFNELELVYKPGDNNGGLLEQPIKNEGGLMDVEEQPKMINKKENPFSENATRTVQPQKSPLPRDGFLEDKWLAGNELQEISPLFDKPGDSFCPLLSPTALSAGPAAAAASAFRAACFKSPCYSTQNISDFSNIANKIKINSQLENRSSLAWAPLHQIPTQAGNQNNTTMQNSSSIVGFKHPEPLNGHPMFQFQQNSIFQ